MTVLSEVASTASPPTLRLYAWRRPTLSLGRHQPAAAADLGFCSREGLDVVRRPTGGRAVLHHHELTYAVIAPLGVAPLPTALQQAYRLICQALVRACRSLGVDAELTAGDVNLHLPGPRTTVPCFETPAGGEVVVGDRKLIGSAMRAHRQAILQHGSILIDWDGRLQAGSMGLCDDRALRSRVTTLTEQLGRLPLRAELEDAVNRAFEVELELRLEPGPLGDRELRRAARLEPDFELPRAVTPSEAGGCGDGECTIGPMREE